MSKKFAEEWADEWFNSEEFKNLDISNSTEELLLGRMGYSVRDDKIEKLPLNALYDDFEESFYEERTIEYLTNSQIIERYGHLLTQEQYEKLKKRL